MGYLNILCYELLSCRVGTVSIDDSGHVTQNVQMDFFNYAGIQRPVKLYTVSSAVHVDDITLITTLLDNGDAQLHYSLEVVYLLLVLMAMCHPDFFFRSLVNVM